MARLRRLAFVTLAAGTSVVIACGAGSLPAPGYVGQPTSALTQVPYPPPPARAEQIPKSPRSGAVWVDGEWVWQARRWSWKKGRWVSPPAGARFSPWTVTRDRTGVLWAASGVWRDASGHEVEETPLTTGKSNVMTVVDPEGAAVPRGPDAPSDAGNVRADDAGALATERLDASALRLLSDGGWLELRPEEDPR